MTTCKCGKGTNQVPLNLNELVTVLQSVRVGGLLLTRAEADNIARRLLLEQATKSLRS